MKNFCVIGNPIDHSLSPKIHNHWFNENKIDAVYKKNLLQTTELEKFVEKLRSLEITGANVTVPFKNSIVPFLDKLSVEAQKTNSVNTIFNEGDKVIGHNTDIAGFELAIRYINYETKRKKVFIIGAGGVCSSIICALENMGCENIFLTNRTLEKSQKIKKIFKKIEIVKWGEIPDFDIVINATSVGLDNDTIDLDLNFPHQNKFFYDVIYNPSETHFLKQARENGNKTENGKMMFIYQAHQSFAIWNKVFPKIDDKTINLIK